MVEMNSKVSIMLKVKVLYNDTNNSTSGIGAANW